jgi:hypothetical protein
MKAIPKIIFLNFIFLCLIFQNSLAQDSNPKPRDLYVNLGFNYVPIDYIGGPSVGLSLYSPDKKLSFNFRYDMGFSFGRGSVVQTIDTVSYITDDNKISLQKYNIRTYIEAEYLLKKFKQHSVYASAGLGWIFPGETLNYLLNEETGYYNLTLATRYKFSWFSIEPRVFIPVFNDNELYKGGSHHPTLFPLSVSLIYKFKPSTKE